jgi:hypothetical protein
VRRDHPQPTTGDRVVVLVSENRGVIVHMAPPAAGETEPIALVQRDDLPANFGPIPYDLHELAVCNLRAAA